MSEQESAPRKKSTPLSAAAEVDDGLQEVGAAFDFLIYVTPTNVAEQWRRFTESDSSASPAFEYRPLPFDPSLLKRMLFNLPIEEVDEPMLKRVFIEKRDELERQITLLQDRGQKKFKEGAVQLYGRPPEDLVVLAEAVLQLTGDLGGPRERDVTADILAERARAEIRGYREVHPSFDARVEVSEEVLAGVMVSNNVLLVSKTACFHVDRVDALLQHEIGTHLVTFFNGQAQPLQIFHAGLAAYEPLQEGLAVIAEWVTGGLEPRRLRTLAARVVAVDAMCRGSEFAETYRLLTERWAFAASAAFQISARVHRGGGLPKDAVYLGGLNDLIRHLSKSSDWRPLFVGKIALAHVPLVERLLDVGVLNPPLFKPRYLSRPGAEGKFQRAGKLSVTEMLQEIIG